MGPALSLTVSPMFMRPLRMHPSAWRSVCIPVASTLSVWLLAACGGGPTPAPRPAAADNRALASEQARGPGAQGTVGVPPFAARGSDTTLTPLAFALAELVSTDLSRSGKVRVVERARLGEVLRELDLAQTGRVDSATAPRVGRLVSAERLVFGSVEPVDANTLRLGARIGDVERSTVSNAVDARAPLAEILAAEKALVFRLFESLGVTLTPAERASIEAQPTKNIGALLAYGRGVQRYYQGDYRGAASEFSRAARLDPGFREARRMEQEVRSYGAMGTAHPVAIPGVRPLDGAISSAVDRLNRPLDLVTNVSRTASTALDPTFPASQATVIITITRP